MTKCMFALELSEKCSNTSMRFDMNADMRSSKLIQTHQIEWQTMQIKQSHCWTVRFGFGQKKWTRWKSTIHSPLHVPLSSKRVIMCFSYRFFSLYMYSYCVRVYYIFFFCTISKETIFPCVSHQSGKEDGRWDFSCLHSIMHIGTYSVSIISDLSPYTMET